MSICSRCFEKTRDCACGKPTRLSRGQAMKKILAAVDLDAKVKALSAEDLANTLRRSVGDHLDMFGFTYAVVEEVATRLEEMADEHLSVLRAQRDKAVEMEQNVRDLNNRLLAENVSLKLAAAAANSSSVNTSASKTKCRTCTKCGSLMETGMMQRQLLGWVCLPCINNAIKHTSYGPDNQTLQS